MIFTHSKRSAVWVLGGGAAAAVLSLWQMDDPAGGLFQVRSATRAELRAPVTGFLREVALGEGERVSAGAVVARLEVPGLAGRLAQRRAAVSEAEAKLRLLEAGPRPAEVWEQRRRVVRGEAWRDLARHDLTRARLALREDLARLDEQVAQYRAELNFAREAAARAQKLLPLKSVSEQDYQDARRKCQVFRALCEQAQAQKRLRQALGTQEAEAELARRDKELTDAQGLLALRAAGPRPEEVQAERARLARLQEETRHLEGLQDRLQVRSPVPGLVTTPHLKEQVGHYVREGDLICTVEEPALLEAEVAVSERDVARVEPGQLVRLNSRSAPLQTFRARVDRVAPTARLEEPNTAPHAAPTGVPGSVTVTCRLAEPAPGLRPGTGGYARIGCGRRAAGEILANHLLRFLWTECWW